MYLKSKAHMLRSKQSRYSKKRLALSRTISTESPRAQAPNWFDVWLPRLSHVAQFGLFVFAIGGFYFTVLPLYQKALLEEAIAMKEVQLTAATNALDSAYSRNRTYAVREFYITAARPCSMGPLPHREKLERVPSNTNMQPEVAWIYSVDVSTCLRDAASKTIGLADLQPIDRKLFDAAVAKLGADMVEFRRSSLMQYQTAPSKISIVDIDELLSHSGSARVRALMDIERWAAQLEGKPNGRKIDLSARRKIAEDLVKENISREYANTIRQGIAALVEIDWSNHVGSSK